VKRLEDFVPQEQAIGSNVHQPGVDLAHIQERMR